MEDHVGKQLMDCFGHTDLYKIFDVDKSADLPKINKSYKMLALKYHPDRKDGDAVKFQAVSAAHSILADPERRRDYDETGSIDSEEKGDFDFWFNYFRDLYPPITTVAIDTFAEKYKGSDEERQDIIAAYLEFDGNVTKMMECIMFAEDGDELRICKVVDEAIESGDIQGTSKYRKFKAALAKGAVKKRKSIPLTGEDNDESFAQLILARQSSRVATMGSIFAKYGGEGAALDDISDEAFEATQRRILHQSNGKSKTRQDRPSKKK